MAEEANIDKAVTAETKTSNEMEIYLKYKRNTQSYKDTMDIDIENIKTFEKRNKVYTTKWRKIYEVIEPEFFEKSDIFQMTF